MFTTKLTTKISFLKHNKKKIALVTAFPILGYVLYLMDIGLPFSNKSKKLYRNSIKGRIKIMQYPAFRPIYDRFCCSDLPNSQGYICSIFDGHSGWQLV